MKNGKTILIFAMLSVAMLLLSACAEKTTTTIEPKPVVEEKETQNEAPAQTEVETGSKITEPKPIETQPKETVTEETPKTDEVKGFKITAKQFTFSPAVIEVNKGDKVRLLVTSVDVPHGFALKEYGINQRLDVGKEVKIEFTADKAGTFVPYCSVACGAGHKEMKGQLIVN